MMVPSVLHSSRRKEQRRCLQLFPDDEAQIMMAVANQQDKDHSSPTTTRTTLLPEDREAITMAEDASSKTCHRRRSYTRQDLELFNVLEHPVYVFDIERKAMWWANKSAITLWGADTLQSLLDRDFAHDMSEATSKRLTDCLRRYRCGEKFSEVWTFYPNGGGPVTTYLTTTGIWIDDQEENDESSISSSSSSSGGRLAMLCEGDMPKEEIDMAALRGVELLRHLPVPVSQFNKLGNVMYQNPEACDVFSRDNKKSVPTSNKDEQQEREVKDNEQQHNDPGDAAVEQDENLSPPPPSSLSLFPVDQGCDFLKRFVDPNLGRCILQSVMENGQDYMDEALQYTTEGPRWFAIKVRRSKDPVTGEPSLLCSARDLTEIKDANRASLAKSEFVAIMAHEIRTPLHQVMGFMELLGETNLTPQQAELVALLENSAMSLTVVVNDILDYTKLEAGRMKLEHILFSTRDVILGSLDVVRNKAQAKSLTLKQNFAPCIPETIIGDPSRIRQLLLNLLQNALKFTGEGGEITLTVTCIVDKQDSRCKNTGGNKNSITNQVIQLRFEVSDTGIGISRENMKHIFKKYQQADPSIARNYGGTGLGLSICKSLTQAMDGSIGVESELDKGSMFWMEIPFELPQTSAPHYNNKNGRRHAVDGTSDGINSRLNDDAPSVSAASESVRPIRILVAEDNKANQKLVKRMLENLGHDVTIAENGAKALDAVEQAKERYDLVLMDVQMPVMDGFEATRELRRRGWTKDELPIIGLTADFQPSERQKYIDVGMDDCLGKPCRMKEIRSYIMKYLLF